MAAEATFRGVLLGGAGTSEGSVMFGGDGMQWRASHTDRVVSIPAGGVSRAEWVSGGRAAELIVTTTAKKRFVFDQFRRGDKASVADALRSATGAVLEDGVVGTTGSNFGSVVLGETGMHLADVEGRRVATVPLAAIAQVMAPARHEVEVQLQEDDTLERGDAALVEMRLHVPPSHDTLDDPDKAAAAPGLEGITSAGIASEREGKADTEGAASDRLRAELIAAAGIHGSIGEAAAEFPDRIGAFLAPRGRYAIEVYPSFLRLVGKSTEFKIAHAKVSRMFYLPRPGNLKDEDGQPVPDRFFFVISLQDPIRQGQQRYPHLVLNLDTERFRCELNASADELKARSLPAVLDEAVPMVLARILKAYTGKKLFRPQHFASAEGHKAVRCALQSNDGFLFPLHQGMVFVHKPACYVRYADVHSVDFTRIGAGAAGIKSRTFDVTVRCRSTGVGAHRDYSFTSFDRSEYGFLKLYFQKRGLSISTDETESAGKAALSRMADEDDVPEDAGTTRSKRRAAKAAAVKTAIDVAGADDDDDDEEADGEFAAASESDSSSSDDDEDDGSAGSDDSDSDDGDAEVAAAGKRMREADEDEPGAKRAKDDDSDDE